MYTPRVPHVQVKQADEALLHIHLLPLIDMPITDMDMNIHIVIVVIVDTILIMVGKTTATATVTLIAMEGLVGEVVASQTRGRGAEVVGVVGVVEPIGGGRDSFSLPECLLISSSSPGSKGSKDSNGSDRNAKESSRRR